MPLHVLVKALKLVGTKNTKVGGLYFGKKSFDISTEKGKKSQDAILNQIQDQLSFVSPQRSFIGMFICFFC